MIRKVLPYLIPSLLLVYITLRCAILSFTHDEALSYLIIKGDEGLKDTANHHYLNSWLMDFFSIMSEHEFSLRLPALLGFFFYAVFILKMIKPVKLHIQLLYFLPVLFLNNYLIDFFSLARGYGLSLGLMMASLYYLLSSEKTLRIRSLGSLFFSVLAVLSNLNLINYFIANIIVLAYLFISNQSFTEIKKSSKFIFAVSLSCVAFLIWCGQRLLFLKEHGQLYYGTENFWDGLDSLFIWSLDLALLPANFLNMLHYFLPLSWLLIAVFIFRKKLFHSNLFVLWLMVSLIITGLLIEHHLFGALYPQNRTFIYLLPLLAGLFGFLLHELDLEKQIKLSIFSIVLFVVIAMPLVVQFSKRMNLQSVAEWGYDAGTKKATEAIGQLKNEKPIVIAHHWLFGPALRYYVMSRNLPFELHQVDQLQNQIPDVIYEFCDQTNLKEQGWKTMLTLKGDATCLYVK